MKPSLEQLRSLLALRQELQENNQVKIARELHDDVCQKLTALSIELSLLQKRLGNKHSEFGKINEILELAGHLNRSVRKTMNDLRPKILDEFGLIAAIKYECQRVGKENNRTILFLGDPDGCCQIEGMLASEVFRLFQEIIFIAPGNSNHSEIRVQVNCDDDLFLMKIADEAKSFSEKRMNKAHPLNVFSIREWVLRLGGKVSFLDRPETAVVLEIPLRKKKKSSRR